MINIEMNAPAQADTRQNTQRRGEEGERGRISVQKRIGQQWIDTRAHSLGHINGRMQFIPT